MTSKEKRDKLVKEIIKPLFKEAGYKCSGSTWYSQRTSCYLVIHMQNSQWNMNEVGFHFWFNINVIIDKEIDSIDQIKRWVNSISMISEAMFLPNYGILHEYRDAMGYKIDGYRNNLLIDIDLDDFAINMINDFNIFILPKLKMIESINDWIKLKEDLANNLKTKKFYLLNYYSIANTLAIADSNLPFLQKHRLELELTVNEIKDNMMMLKKVQRNSSTVSNNAEEFILKSLQD